jgi:hypothetical protein
VFVAVGDSGTLLTSSDGLAWTVRAAPGSAALNGVAFGNGSFVAAGLGGAIYQSGPMLHLEIIKSTVGSSLVLSSPPGIQAVIQSSTDLTGWKDLFSLAVTQTTQTFPVTNSPAGGTQFYRAVTR